MSYQRTLAAIQRVRPYFQQDGGDIELIEFTADRTAKVKLHGRCIGCPSAVMSIHVGLEMAIREEVPDLAGVVVVE